MTPSFCICGDPVGECPDCYPKPEIKKDYQQPKIEKNYPIPLEKLEPISNDVLLGKFTELTRMFYSAIKNSSMSEDAKSKLREPYKLIEKELVNQLGIVANKNKKKCENSGCLCTDCAVTKKRWTAKKMFLTIPYNCAPKSLVLDYYKNKYNLCKVAIAQETHKQAKPDAVKKYGTDIHLHVYIEWTAKKDIKNPSYLNLDESFEQYGNINTDIETIRKRTKENVFSYILKTDKEALSWGFNIHMDVYGKLKKKELWYKVVSGEWSLKDIIKYDPSILIDTDIEKLYTKLNKNWTLCSNKDKQYMFSRTSWGI